MEKLKTPFFDYHNNIIPIFVVWNRRYYKD